MKSFASFFAFILFIFLSNTITAQPSPKHEFRAVWIATVINIDWPSKTGLTTTQQKDEFINILNAHQRNGINAVIVQIRPVADAFYASPYEPWSEYLTGVQGQAPYPYYDPLEFMIEETHKRGMEFHAWVNPYRAVFDINKSSISPSHITKKRKDWFITYGTKKYFDPGQPEVMDFVTNIVKDIIQRYDVDAIHMDDYFYPYRISGKEFPDNASYKKYGGGLSRDEWRRANCDSIIKRIYDTIIAINPHVKFGISPFGVWRNKSKDANGSDTKAGQTNYDDLYADILLWMKNGWIDYVVPQLYWEIGHHLCDYNVLLKWWADNSYGKHVYIGHAVYRTNESPVWHNVNELPNEIKALRSYDSTVKGSAYFSSKDLLSNSLGFMDSLRNNYYRYPAIIPPMPWVNELVPDKPVNVSIEKTNDILLKGSIVPKEDDKVKSIVIYLSDSITTLGQQPHYINSVFNGDKFNFSIPQNDIPAEWNNCYIAISVINSGNNESGLSEIFKLVRQGNSWKIK